MSVTSVRFSTLKPIPDRGAEVRISLTKSSKEASKIWLSYYHDQQISLILGHGGIEFFKKHWVFLQYLFLWSIRRRFNAWICSWDPKAIAGLPTSRDWVGDEIPVFGPTAMSLYSIFSSLLQYRLCSLSMIRPTAFISLVALCRSWEPLDQDMCLHRSRY